LETQAENPFRLAALDPGELARFTSAAAGRPARQPSAHARPVDYAWDTVATAGLWRVDVTDAGAPAATFFVKLVRNTRLWPGLSSLPTDEARAAFISYYPWHFELDIHQSGIESVLPPGLRTPILHAVAEADPDHLGLWWEFIDQRAEPWQLPDYRLAASLLGQLAARRRAGAAGNKALPGLCRAARDSALRTYTQTRVLSGILPALNARRYVRPRRPPA
jgi:hypothetical protein